MHRSWDISKPFYPMLFHNHHGFPFLTELLGFIIWSDSSPVLQCRKSYPSIWYISYTFRLHSMYWITASTFPILSSPAWPLKINHFRSLQLFPIIFMSAKWNKAGFKTIPPPNITVPKANFSVLAHLTPYLISFFSNIVLKLGQKHPNYSPRLYKLYQSPILILPSLLAFLMSATSLEIVYIVCTLISFIIPVPIFLSRSTNRSSHSSPSPKQSYLLHVE